MLKISTPSSSPRSMSASSSSAKSDASTDDDPGIAAAAEKAIRQERKIARMPAMTVEGYHHKIGTISKSGFDDDVLLGCFCWVATRNGSASLTHRLTFARTGEGLFLRRRTLPRECLDPARFE
jgi:hypothetical protein